MRKNEVGGRCAGKRSVTFVKIPPAIRALGHDVRPLIKVLPDVAQIQITGDGIKGEAPRISHADGPKFRPHIVGIDGEAVEIRRADPWIVGGNKIIGQRWQGGVRIWRQVAGQFVHVNPHDGREKILVYALRIGVGVAAAAFVAERNI
jgi:hypothetical protein